MSGVLVLALRCCVCVAGGSATYVGCGVVSWVCYSVDCVGVVRYRVRVALCTSGVVLCVVGGVDCVVGVSYVGSAAVARRCGVGVIVVG